MSLELEIARSARTDLLEVWVHIAEDDFDAADKTLARIKQTARLLCQTCRQQ